MKTIIFNSIKGGVGKSTLSAQLSAFLSENYKIGIIDCDPQQTFFRWYERRKEKDNNLIKNIHILSYDFDFSKKSNFDYIIIDSPGIDSKIGREMLLNSDIAISLFRPSQADIDTVLKHNKLILEAKKFNKKLELYYIFNACPTHARNKELKESLDIFDYLLKNNFIDANIIENGIYNRTILRSSFGEGSSCFENNRKNNKSRLELTHIFNRILGE